MASSSATALDELFTYLDNGPQCIVALNHDSGFPLKVNSTFERLMGPLFKFASYAFADSAEKNDDRERMRKAISSVISNGDAQRLRNVEMISLSDGLPIRRHFDWTVGQGADGTVLLFGDRCNQQDEEQIARDAELIDFFDNAPIALHWLSGEGIVLWANKTEMNVLGYSPEEYIGQPIMKFCPDEEELVLEIFKQLGTGNAIKDVPVRFRTKDGKIVHLLIDSNIRYNPDGSFGHTRCFIRDDTGRKVQEARARLLLEETKRSLVYMDNFMSRTLHHIVTPLHVMQNTTDLLLEKMCKCLKEVDSSAASECEHILTNSNDHISKTRGMVKHILELVKFEQGGILETVSELVDIRSFGLDILNKAPKTSEGVQMKLLIEQGTPAVVTTDTNVLERVIFMLLENAVTSSSDGTVAFSIGLCDDRCTFSVKNNVSNIERDEYLAEAGKCGTLPKIFQRYQEELSNSEIVDFDKAENLRVSIESNLACCQSDRLGVGLSLTYHLISSLGGELRYLFNEEEKMQKYWFSLPSRFSRHAILQGKLLNGEVIKKGSIPDDKIVEGEQNRSSAPMNLAAIETMEIDSRNNAVTGVPRLPPLSSIPPVSSKTMASKGVFKANDPPLVLVVEDTPICAKLLIKQLSKLNCATAHAENGRIAVDMLRESSPDAYSLILMDIRMPVMDGMDATRIIKNEMKLNVPVVALTGETSENVKMQCMDIGFDEFCTKPMKRAKLQDIVSQFTNPSGQNTSEKKGEQ